MIFVAQAYQILTTMSAIPANGQAGAQEIVVYDDAALSAVRTSNTLILVIAGAVFALLVFSYFRNRRGDAPREETPWPVWATAAFLVVGFALSALFAALLFPAGAAVLLDDVPNALHWPVRIGLGLIWPGFLLPVFRQLLPYGYRRRLYQTLGAVDLTTAIVAGGVLVAFDAADGITKLPLSAVEVYLTFAVPVLLGLVLFAIAERRHPAAPGASKPPAST